MLNSSSSLSYFKEENYMNVVKHVKNAVVFGCKFYLEHPFISHMIIASASRYILTEVFGEEACGGIKIRITKGDE